MLTFYRSLNSPAGLNAWRLLDFSAVPGPPGALPPTPSGGTPTTEEEAGTRAEAPSGEVIGNTNVFISGASANTRVVLSQYTVENKLPLYSPLRSENMVHPPQSKRFLILSDFRLPCKLDPLKMLLYYICI
jgi:hypothetical protein